MFSGVSVSSTLDSDPFSPRVTTPFTSLLSTASAVGCAAIGLLFTPLARTGAVAIRLVDYDGLCVPALAHTPAREHGHPCYQHPRRRSEPNSGPDVDRFSHLVIYTALSGLAAAPDAQLWQRFHCGDNMLFRAEDFTAPSRSPLLRALWDLGGDVRALVGYLILAAVGPATATPLLHDLVRDGAVAPLASADLDRVAALLGAVPPSPATSWPSSEQGPALEVVDGPARGRRFTFTGHDLFVAAFRDALRPFEASRS